MNPAAPLSVRYVNLHCKGNANDHNHSGRRTHPTNRVVDRRCSNLSHAAVTELHRGDFSDSLGHLGARANPLMSPKRKTPAPLRLIVNMALSHSAVLLVNDGAPSQPCPMSEIKSEHIDGVTRRELESEECARWPEQPEGLAHTCSGKGVFSRHCNIPCKKGVGGAEALSRCQILRATNLFAHQVHTAATTSRHVSIADARKARCVLAEVRWR
jgi:hypothetical protein